MKFLRPVCLGVIGVFTGATLVSASGGFAATDQTNGETNATINDAPSPIYRCFEMDVFGSRPLQPEFGFNEWNWREYQRMATHHVIEWLNQGCAEMDEPISLNKVDKLWRENGMVGDDRVEFTSQFQKNIIGSLVWDQAALEELMRGDIEESRLDSPVINSFGYTVMPREWQYAVSQMDDAEIVDSFFSTDTRTVVMPRKIGIKILRNRMRCLLMRWYESQMGNRAVFEIPFSVANLIAHMRNEKVQVPQTFVQTCLKYFESFSIAIDQMINHLKNQVKSELMPSSIRYSQTNAHMLEALLGIPNDGLDDRHRGNQELSSFFRWIQRFIFGANLLTPSIFSYDSDHIVSPLSNLRGYEPDWAKTPLYSAHQSGDEEMPFPPVFDNVLMIMPPHALVGGGESYEHRLSNICLNNGKHNQNVDVTNDTDWVDLFGRAVYAYALEKDFIKVNSNQVFFQRGDLNKDEFVGTLAKIKPVIEKYIDSILNQAAAAETPFSDVDFAILYTTIFKEELQKNFRESVLQYIGE